jgi:elongator complex protein 3
VQILDDDILKTVNRGHGVKEVIEATARCKAHGLKVCYHIMPGLPGSSIEKDMASFHRIFTDPGFRPDMLKFYPTLVIPGTELYDLWKSGKYIPYGTEEGVSLISQMKSMVPEYVRIQRLQRDIPVPQIAAGIMKSNLRELAQERLLAQGKECRCIRCREVGQNDISLDNPSLISFKDFEYQASGGTEHFMSLEYDDMLIGYARLRLDTEIASLRELKVFGKMAGIGEDGEWQHRGFGKQLMTNAENTAKAAGIKKMRVTSGVGVREYYASIGFIRDGPYMMKDLTA